MGKQFYHYHQRYIQDYIRDFPDNAIKCNGAKVCISGWMIKNGCKPHFRQYVHEHLWQDHREQLAIRHWKILLQKAQDSRFKTKIRSIEDVRRSRSWIKRRLTPEQSVARLAEQKRQKELREASRKKNIDIARFMSARKAKRNAAYKEREQLLKDWEIRHASILPQKRSHRLREKYRRKLLRERKRDPGIEAHIDRIQYQPGYCHWCNVFLPNGGEADHVTPVSKGGGDWIYNIVRSCKACNRDKRDALPNSTEIAVTNQLEMSFACPNLGENTTSGTSPSATLA